MSDLLDLAIEAHGGARRWASLLQFQAAASMTGAIWSRKARAEIVDDVHFDGSTGTQKVTITPFPETGHQAVWEPRRPTTITPAPGTTINSEPAANTPQTREPRQHCWDDLQVATLAAQAAWNRIVAPFILVPSEIALALDIAHVTFTKRMILAHHAQRDDRQGGAGRASPRPTEAVSQQHTHR
jgi:hypothetical protein